MLIGHARLPQPNPELPGSDGRVVASELAAQTNSACGAAVWQEIKDAAAKNNIAGAKILAKNLVRLRAQQTKLLSAMAGLRGVNVSMATAGGCYCLPMGGFRCCCCCCWCMTMSHGWYWPAAAAAAIAVRRCRHCTHDVADGAILKLGHWEHYREGV